MGKCKRLADADQVAVDMAAAVAKSSRTAKRRKVDTSELGEELRLISSSLAAAVVTLENSVSPADSSDTCCAGDVVESCCSSNGSTEEVVTEGSKFSDLEEEENVEIEIKTSTTYNIDGRERRETTPTSGFKRESDGLESIAKPSTEASSRRSSSTEMKMPSDDELEEFLASAEKNLHKQFKDKYNYDFVNDLPLEGRYEWVQMKP